MGFCPQLGGVGPCPAQCIWQGSGFAADQTNAMLAVGGTSCISLVSVAAADENSLTPLHRLLPTETASLAVGGTRCISLISVAAADENSLTPLHRLLPTETALLGFGGSPVGGGD